MKIRWSYDRLISTMEFPITVRWDLYIELGPGHQQWTFVFCEQGVNYPGHLSVETWGTMPIYWYVYSKHSHTYLADRMPCNKQTPGLGYSYSVLAALEYWISGTCTLLVLVSSTVIVLVRKCSGTHTSAGTSTDILCYICDVGVKTIIPVK